MSFIYLCVCVINLDTSCFAKFQGIVFKIIYNPFAVLFIILCILLNTIFMALDHHDMDRELDQVQRLGNYVNIFCFITMYSHEQCNKDAANLSISILFI